MVEHGADDAGRGPVQRLTYREAMRKAQRAYLLDLMRATGGLVSEAARVSGLNRQHLYRVLQLHGVPHAVKRRPERPTPMPGRRANRGNAAWRALALY